MKQAPGAGGVLIGENCCHTDNSRIRTNNLTILILKYFGQIDCIISSSGLTKSLPFKLIQEVCWYMDGSEFTRLSLKYYRHEQHLKKSICYSTWSWPEVLLCEQSKVSEILCNFWQKLYFVFKEYKIWVLINTCTERTNIMNNKHPWSNNFRRKKSAVSPILKLRLITYLKKEKCIFRNTSSYS